MCNFRIMKMTSCSYLWWTTPPNARLPSPLCIFLAKMGQSNSAENALWKNLIKIVSGTWSKEPLPSWKGTVPWWTYQWTSAELLPTNLINPHGWCGEELWKEKEKVTLLKNYSEMLMFFVCLSCLCLSLLSPLLSTLMCLVYASGSAMKRNLQV